MAPRGQRSDLLRRYRSAGQARSRRFAMSFRPRGDAAPRRSPP